MAAVAVAKSESSYGPMATLELDAALLQSQWELCDKVADYLSHIVGQLHGDPARYSNFLSVTVNELVELAFKTSAVTGPVKFELYREVGLVRVKLSFHCAADARAAICVGLDGRAQKAALAQDLGRVIINDVSRLAGFADVCQVQLAAAEEAPDRIALTAGFLWHEEHP